MSDGAEAPMVDQVEVDQMEETGELAAYNRYLAELNASDRPKRW